MKNQAFVLVTMLSLSIASFAADLDSSVSGISIKNTHQVDGKDILRGSQPGKKLTELKAWGVTDVIIFKNQTKAEVDEEILAAAELGLRTHHIPFKWKELESAEVACRQVIQGLKVLSENKAKKRVSYFHCTVGEDRTGLLAGVWRMLDDGISEGDAWTNEMCAHGYADGNPNKPAAVSASVHAELTPLFHTLSEKIKAGELSLGNLNPEVCKGIAPKKIKRNCKAI